MRLKSRMAPKDEVSIWDLFPPEFLEELQRDIAEAIRARRIIADDSGREWVGNANHAIYNGLSIPPKECPLSISSADKSLDQGSESE